MGRGKFKGKPTGRRNFSTPEEIAAGTSGRPRTFKKNLAEEEKEEEEEEIEESEEEESEDESDGKAKHKGTEGLIQIENPNLVKAKNIKAKEVDEIEKQKAHERYMKLQEQGKTEQARKDLERLALIRQQRADAAKKREEEKAAKEQRKAEARK
uniref:Casein kinase substrate phosphoprotein PP28 domain-containing protein n=1 Tax=Leersia perrieri TaxID=77586 RepID=A0A0D9V5R1_9ORYZ